MVKKLEELNLPPSVKLVDGATGGFSLISVFETYKDCKFIIIDAIKVVNEKKLSYRGESQKSLSLIDKPDSKEKTKGKIYVIPLNKLYEISKKESDFRALKFLSFHQIGLMDVLILLYMTSKIKISGYLVGIFILEENGDEDFLKFSMNLSTEIGEKIPQIIETVKTLI